MRMRDINFRVYNIIYIYIYEDILVIIKLYITGFRAESQFGSWIFLIKPEPASGFFFI